MFATVLVVKFVSSLIAYFEGEDVKDDKKKKDENVTRSVRLLDWTPKIKQQVAVR